MARNTRNNNNRNSQVKREQPRKDSKSKRINMDNERVSKAGRDFKEVKEELKEIGFKKTGKCNDIRWYASNPELLKSAASLPFSTTAGMPLPFTNDTTVPGVLTVRYIPSLGMNSRINSGSLATNANQSAVNQAAKNIYSFVVHANSRNQSYDAPDLMLNIMAGAQVFAYIALGIRAYGTMRKFHQQNNYTPQALINAMGFDYDDLSANLANMWFDLNELIARASQIWIPNDLPFIERWFWLNTNIYRDGDSVKSQYYMFIPKQIYMLSETGSTTGTSLIPVSWDVDGGRTWEGYMTLANNMLNALLDSQDRGIMYGDILKAYGPEKLYRIQEITSDYMVEPVYDQEVLTQIENSNSFSRLAGAITQSDTGVIYQNFSTTGTTGDPVTPTIGMSNYPIQPQILNFHTPEAPTPEMIMISTRLKSCGGFVTMSSGVVSAVAPVATGTEYVFDYEIWFYNAGQLTNEHITSDYWFNPTTGSGSHIRAMAHWAAFDWAPWLYSISGTTLSSYTAVGSYGKGVAPAYAVGDFDQYTTIDFDELIKMHATAQYSEFGVPSI